MYTHINEYLFLSIYLSICLYVYPCGTLQVAGLGDALSSKHEWVVFLDSDAFIVSCIYIFSVLEKR